MGLFVEDQRPIPGAATEYAFPVIANVKVSQMGGAVEIIAVDELFPCGCLEQLFGMEAIQHFLIAVSVCGQIDLGRSLLQYVLDSAQTIGQLFHAQPVRLSVIPGVGASAHESQACTPRPMGAGQNAILVPRAGIIALIHTAVKIYLIDTGCIGSLQVPEMPLEALGIHTAVFLSVAAALRFCGGFDGVDILARNMSGTCLGTVKVEKIFSIQGFSIGNVHIPCGFLQLEEFSVRRLGAEGKAVLVAKILHGLQVILDI